MASKAKTIRIQWEACSGEAHRNAFINSCAMCAPGWGCVARAVEPGDVGRVVWIVGDKASEAYAHAQGAHASRYLGRVRKVRLGAPTAHIPTPGTVEAIGLCGVRAPRLAGHWITLARLDGESPTDRHACRACVTIARARVTS